MSPKNGLERRGRTSGVGNPPSSADLNDARKRGRSPSADRRRGWARGELPRTAFPRAPPPEARRATERGRTPRRTPPIFTRALCPQGTGPRERRGPWPRQRRASPAGAGRASSTRSPAVDAEGVTAGRGMASPRRRPRPAASAAGLWPKRGRPAPSEAKRSEGQRSGAAAPRVRGEAAQRGAA